MGAASCSTGLAGVNEQSLRFRERLPALLEMGGSNPQALALAASFSCQVNVADYENIGLDTSTRLPTDIVWLQFQQWAMVRVKLDNPGLWPLHCHHQMHVINGMFAVMNVMPDKQPTVPKELLKHCPCDTSSNDDTVEISLPLFIALVGLACLITIACLVAHMLKNRWSTDTKKLQV